FFDFTETAEVDFRNRLDAHAAACAASWSFLGFLHHGFDVNLHVFLEHAAMRAGSADRTQLDAELASQLTHRWTSVNLGAIFGRCLRSRSSSFSFWRWRGGRSSRFC